ncbi:LysR substrate-binding domain-containing protein [Sphingobium fluviale]|uniref:LysR family transcriptional regulator n=1 Tax=Sphingobium fluviale TaxID=2506423 RepID=A0A4Q1KBS1_9SPHN|nr:LysR substrate-binding domain-containing protein [Sphingobium fluviale]RXR23696.1 LysR family transcriptional regulator [Sphingobium fluviale]
MTFDQLRIFVIVANHLNMRRAAELLNRTQPAVSAAIGALESRGNVRLFHRVGRHLELTEVGKTFLPEAQAVLLRMEAARRTLSDLAGGQTGTLHIFASQTVATYWLPSRMARFAATHPAVQLSLSVGNTTQALAAIVSGKAELGFIEGRVDETNILSQTIGEDRLGLYVARDHPLAETKVDRKQLSTIGWILREKGSGTRDHLVSGLRGLGLEFEDLDIRLELPSNGAVLNAVITGNFVCAVSDLAAESRLHAGMLSRLDCELPARTFKMIAHRERYKSRIAQAFIDAVN